MTITKIVIADDELSLRLLVRATIESEQLEVIEAADGLEAWRLIEEHRPLVVLLDIQMPGRTGIDLTQAIRAHPTLRDTRVILLSSRARDTDVAEGLMAGADRYLTKPFSPTALLNVVNELSEID